MRAAYTEHYLKQPEDLEIVERPRPEPGTGEVLLRVRAVALNDFDWGILSGQPWFIRLFLGWRRPKIRIPGCDIAGEVVALGTGATRWRMGDRVYGDLSGGRFGGFAEYVCCREDQLAAMPDDMRYEEAAAIPQAAILAWQGLEAGGGLRDRQTVLFNGAGGGVGSFGVQLARQFEVTVTGVDSGEKLEFMRSVGFDHVLDYRKQDFTRSGERYDVIVDAKTSRWPWDYARALRPGGVYATVGGSMPKFMFLMLMAPVMRLLTGKRLRVIGLKANAGLDLCNSLWREGRLRCHIEGPYPFTELPRELARFLRAEHRGKVVLSLDEAQ